MGGGMMDMGDMMDWMDSMGVHGAMHWNDDMDSCVFMPDSAMMPECDYMIMMDLGGMMSHDGHMMDATGHEHGLGLYHFTTGLPEYTTRRMKEHLRTVMHPVCVTPLIAGQVQTHLPGSLLPGIDHTCPSREGGNLVLVAL